MNKPTHLIFGEIIWKYLDENYGITLNRAGFLLGNIAPDLTFSFVLHPHERKYASEHLRAAIDAAIKAGDIMDFDAGFFLAERLGSICHYCADFFCEAHTERYEGNLKEHIMFEKSLYRYCAHNEKALGETMRQPRSFSVSGTGDIFRKIEEMNDAYLAGKPSCRAQAEGALSACLQTVGTIMTTRYYAAFNVEPGFLVH